MFICYGFPDKAVQKTSLKITALEPLNFSGDGGSAPGIPYSSWKVSPRITGKYFDFMRSSLSNYYLLPVLSFSDRTATVNST